MAFIQRAFLGEERLWKVWWLGGSVISLGVFLWSRYVVLPLALSAGDAGTRNAAVVFFLFGPAGSLAWTVAEWRCAFNVRWRGWGWIARICLVAGLALSLPMSWYGLQLLLGNVPPSYGPVAAALWKGQNSGENSSIPSQVATYSPAAPTSPSTDTEPASTPAYASASETAPRVVQYLDPQWQKAPATSGESEAQVHAVYAGHSEKATIGLARWTGSVAEFGDAATARMTGFQRVGKAGDGTFNGSAVWATELKGAVEGTPYFAVLYVLRDKNGMLCWVFALSAYPVDTEFINRTWTLAQAAGAGEYPQ